MVEVEDALTRTTILMTVNEDVPETSAAAMESRRSSGKVWKAVETLRRATMKLLDMPGHGHDDPSYKIAITLLERLVDALQCATEKVRS